MEEALTELARFGPLLEVRLGQVLAPLVRGGHKHLGYVTPAMSCREELGISATAAWDSVRLAGEPGDRRQYRLPGQRLEKHGVLRQALCEGRLSPTKVDMLLRLPRRADAENWAAYAEEHTCRRLEEAVEAALVLATRFPSAWNLRRGTPPGEEETLEDFRRQAGLQALEATCQDLARAFEQADSGRSTPEGVQTSAAPLPAPAPDFSPGGTDPKEEPAGGARSPGGGLPGPRRAPGEGRPPPALPANRPASRLSTPP